MDTTTRGIVTRYYALANAGDWDTWCDLFATGTVMDEQIAGHVEGRDALRELMKGFPRTYTSFTNSPVHVVVEGEQAAVVSHISGVTVKGDKIEADVTNYFQVRDGEIAYFANFHDTVPFAPALSD
jgi:ketosteroid isomerase-like protein